MAEMNDSPEQMSSRKTGASSLPRGTASKRKYWILFISIALAITGLDLFTKHLAFSRLEVKLGPNPNEFQRKMVVSQKPVVVIGDLFELEANINYGAFRGWFSEHRIVLVLLSLGALLVITWFLWSHLNGPPPHRLWFAAALGLLFGGTCGNLYDRAKYGFVRDFIKWFYRSDQKEHVWPNFNIADSAISVGVCIILALFLFTKTPSQGKRKS